MDTEPLTFTEEEMAEIDVIGQEALRALRDWLVQHPVPDGTLMPLSLFQVLMLVRKGAWTDVGDY